MWVQNFHWQLNLDRQKKIQIKFLLLLCTFQKKKKSILKKNSIGEKRKSSDVGQDKVEEEIPISENLTATDQVKTVNHDDEQKSNEIETESEANVVEHVPAEDDIKQAKQSDEKTPLEIINDILNPPMPEFDPTKPYNVPTAVKAGDVNALQELDERKIIELKEVGSMILALR